MMDWSRRLRKRLTRSNATEDPPGAALSFDSFAENSEIINRRNGSTNALYKTVWSEWQQLVGVKSKITGSSRFR